MTTNIAFTFDATEQEEAQIIINAQDVHCKLSDFQEQIRGFLAHGHKFESAFEVLEYMEKELANIKTIYMQ